MNDPFERYAEECGLLLDAEPITAAPRDVLAPLTQAERHHLVALSRPDTGAAPVRMIFLSPVSDDSSPALRDVLWWLSSDAWMVEHTRRNLGEWAAAYGYPPANPATGVLFRDHVRQADALSAVLGGTDYRRLLQLFEAEEAPTSVR